MNAISNVTNNTSKTHDENDGGRRGDNFKRFMGSRLAHMCNSIDSLSNLRDSNQRSQVGNEEQMKSSKIRTCKGTIVSRNGNALP